MSLAIDLNSDLGEGFGVWALGDDEALLDVVTSANVACGFHAGDPDILRRVCAIAAERGVAIGAHVGYRDLAGFGRRDMDVEPQRLTNDVIYQIGALDGFARVAGTRVRYVKPHGALYNTAVHDQQQAAAVVEAIHLYDESLPVMGLPGSALLTAAGSAGLRTIGEAFADRGYAPDGTLVPGRSREPCCTTRSRWPSEWPGWSPRAQSQPRTAPRSPSRPSRSACTATPPVPCRWPSRSARLSPRQESTCAPSPHEPAPADLR